MIIRTEQELNNLLDKLDQADRWAFDTEGAIRTYPNWDFVGVSISLDGKTGYYIPVGHDEGSQLDKEFVIEKLKPYFLDKDKLMYIHNAKYDMEAVRLINPIEFFPDNIFCTMTASFILDVNNPHGLKESVLREFNHKMIELNDFVPKEKCEKTKDKIYLTSRTLIEDMAPYAIDDAVQTYRLGELYRKRISKEGFDKVFYELEMPFIFILMELEEQGIKLDKEKLSTFMEEAPKKVAEIEGQIREMLPEEHKEINLNSTKQLNVLFFDDMKIKPIGNRTKTNLYSVSADNLEVWGIQHKICRMILSYRRLSKLANTYIQNMYNRLSPDGRIRCNFNRHVAVTGRLSSSRMNLQNIPRSENDVYGLRDLFIAGKGKKLVVAD